MGYDSSVMSTICSDISSQNKREWEDFHLKTLAEKGKKKEDLCFWRRGLLIARDGGAGLWGLGGSDATPVGVWHSGEKLGVTLVIPFLLYLWPYSGYSATVMPECSRKLLLVGTTHSIFLSLEGRIIFIESTLLLAESIKFELSAVCLSRFERVCVALEHCWSIQAQLCALYAALNSTNLTAAVAIRNSEYMICKLVIKNAYLKMLNYYT